MALFEEKIVKSREKIMKSCEKCKFWRVKRHERHRPHERHGRHERLKNAHFWRFLKFFYQKLHFLATRWRFLKKNWENLVLFAWLFENFWNFWRISTFLRQKIQISTFRQKNDIYDSQIGQFWPFLNDFLRNLKFLNENATFLKENWTFLKPKT